MYAVCREYFSFFQCLRLFSRDDIVVLHRHMFLLANRPSQSQCPCLNCSHTQDLTVELADATAAAAAMRTENTALTAQIATHAHSLATATDTTAALRTDMAALQHAQKQADIARIEAETRLQSALAQADKDRIESETRMDFVRQQAAADAAAAEARLENAQAQAALAVAEAEARSQHAHEQAAIAVVDAEARLENAQKEAALAVAEAEARWAATEAECETAHRQWRDTSAALTNVQRALTDANAQVRVMRVLLCVDCLVNFGRSIVFS
jgi:hypothetical protein